MRLLQVTEASLSTTARGEPSEQQGRRPQRPMANATRQSVEPLDNLKGIDGDKNGVISKKRQALIRQ